MVTNNDNMQEAPHRMTKQRQVLLEALQRVKSHPTADELYAMVREELPKVSLGTVYRNLDVLVKTGQIRKLENPGGQSRYDADLSDHYHVRCQGCGGIGDVSLEDHPQLSLPKQRSSQYTITEYRLEFLGWCPRCLAKEETAL